MHPRENPGDAHGLNDCYDNWTAHSTLSRISERGLTRIIERSAAVSANWELSDKSKARCINYDIIVEIVILPMLTEEMKSHIARNLNLETFYHSDVIKLQNRCR